MAHVDKQRARIAAAVVAAATIAGSVSLAPRVEAAFPGANGKIAFSGYQDGNFEIYSVNPDGSGLTRLTTDPGRDVQPAWSPDGTRIAFASDRNDPGRNDIFVMNFDGTGLVQLTANAGSDQLQPTWSPDGTQIAFTSNESDGPGIWRMNSDGSGQTLVVNAPASEFDPAWSPDGSRIAYWSFEDGDPDIWTVTLDGSSRRNVTTNSARDFAPTWSPDGARIAFQSDLDGDDDIYTVNPDGTGLINVSATAGYEQSPAWSPDGSRIAFTRGRDVDPARDIYAMGIDGSSSQPVHASSSEEMDPDWQRIGSSSPTPPATSPQPTLSGSPSPSPTSTTTTPSPSPSVSEPTGPVTDGRCVFDPGTGHLLVRLGGRNATLKVGVNNLIRIGDQGCAGATTSNTESITLSGTAEMEYVTIDLGGGSFAPGLTPEGSGTSEIEFTLDLRGGANELIVRGRRAAETFSVGTNGVALNQDADTDVAYDRRASEWITLWGEGGSDRLSGRGGFGTGGTTPHLVRLIGGSGGDHLIGGGGNDWVWGDTGNDSIRGGRGTDTALYNYSGSRIRASLATGRAAGEGKDSLGGIENLVGSRFDDRFEGNGRSNKIDTGRGADVLHGGDGPDRLIAGAGRDQLHGGSGNDFLDGGDGVDTCYQDGGTGSKRSCELPKKPPPPPAGGGSGGGGSGCDPSYPDFCIEPPPPDLDCPEVGRTDFRVTGSDPHGFDGDNDGVGCES